MTSETVQFAPVAASADPVEKAADDEHPAEWEVQNIPGWTPAMTLEVEEVKSGEEDEEELFMRRAKLYRFCRATAEWKERALGDARILKNKQYAFYVQRTVRFCQWHFFLRDSFSFLIVPI